MTALATLVNRGHATLDDDAMLTMIEQMSDDAAAKLLAIDQTDR